MPFSQNSDPAVCDQRSRYVLVAGDIGDIDEIRQVLSDLPRDAYGRVIIEIAAPLQVVPLDAPPRVAVTWLRRDERSSLSKVRAAAERGETLVRAVDAWLDEWMRASDDPSSEYVLWIGSHASDAVNEFCVSLAHELRAYSAPGTAA